MSGFAKRRIDLAFSLGKGSFGNSGYDTINLSGLRASATIFTAGIDSSAEMQLRVYGMSLSHMNQLTTLGKLTLDDVRNNVVAVSAGSDGSGMTLIFQGTIIQAWADPQNAPFVPLVVTAVATGLEALKPVPVTSYKGAADVAVILRNLAQQMGMAFENNGVSVILQNPYYPGTAYSQAMAAIADAGINHVFDVGDGSHTLTLAIWPRNSTRGGTVPLISKDTGLVGYPTFTQTGIMLQTIFNPSIAYGRSFEVKSDLTAANGQWTVISVGHDLESETPGGAWFTRVEASVFGHPLPLPAR